MTQEVEEKRLAEEAKAKMSLADSGGVDEAAVAKMRELVAAGNPKKAADRLRKLDVEGGVPARMRVLLQARVPGCCPLNTGLRLGREWAPAGLPCVWQHSKPLEVSALSGQRSHAFSVGQTFTAQTAAACLGFRPPRLILLACNITSRQATKFPCEVVH